MKFLAFIACLCGLAGCAPQEHYEWGAYEDSLYGYYRNPTAADQYTRALAEAARMGDAAGRTAPGVHAEYGYMLLTSGNAAAAIQEFQSEKRLWPESATLMDRMVSLAGGSRTVPSVQQSAPVSNQLVGKAGS